MSTEAGFRALAGHPSPALTFMGREFALREDGGLVPLLRYAQTVSAHPGDGAEAQEAALAASYHLLEDTVVEFRELADLAFRAKAQFSDITAAISCVAAFYCARNHWAGMRLIGHVAANMEEIDGQLLRAGGRGLAGLSAREACNLALAILLDGREEEDRAVFLQDLNYEGNPEAEALALVRQMQAARAATEAADG